MNTVAGIDLSLRGCGLVAVPADWNGFWARIAHATVGHPLKSTATEADKIGRLVRLSAEIVDFVQKHRCTLAVLEQYAFTSMHSRAHSLGELGGVVKVLLSECVRIPVDVVPPASARKLLCGKLPRKDVKIHVRGALTRMDMPVEWTDDEADAFVVANWAQSALGGYALVQADPGGKAA
jgi:Holliday junction resolvasome RuvABC endonuclease subunit